MAYAPTITTYADMSPCPRAEVLFDSLDPSAAKVDVYRLAAGREYKMRGGVQASVAGALTRIDFEIPPGVPVTYRAEMFDSFGLSLGFTSSGTAQVDFAQTVIHNPLDPQGATTVTLLNSAGRSVKRPVEGDVVWPIGRTVGVVLATQRRGIQDVALDIVVDSYDEADRIQAMLGGYTSRTVPVMCVRLGSNDRARLPRPLFAAVLDMSEDNLTYGKGDELVQFTMTGSEVAPPTPALIVPLLTNADVNAAYATNALLTAAYLTNLQINRDYSKAGTA